jgi:hypothetical protein
MKTRIIFLLFAIFSVVPTTLIAKEFKPKFGKIPMEELTSNVCPIDSNAHAYYLFDIGNSSFIYSNNDGFEIEYYRHFRIKILDKSGLDYATISIPYYDSGSSRAKVQNIKAYSYNLEDGKIIKTQLKRDAIFDEQTSKNWKQKKFAIPNVKEGSVIEVSYCISTNTLWSFPGWQFQYYIPVLHSEYEVCIPEYFNYNHFFRGYHFIKSVKSVTNGSIPQGNNQSITYWVNEYNYSLTNVPAFPIGEKLTTPENYICKLEYELASYQFPGSMNKSFSQKWEDVDKILYEEEDFGVRLKTIGFLKEDAEAISLTTSDKMGKMNAAFNSIKKKMKWNENSSCWSTSPLKKSYETGTGNSADINLTLVALLRQLDIEAYPVVLSTRKNGMIHPANPSINQMNYVIALCKIDGKNYLMDATEKYSEVNVLPERCLNNEGRIIDQVNLGWIPLLQEKLTRSVTSYTIAINEEGKITGDIETSDNNYKALEKRSSINDYESVEKHIEKLQEYNAGLTIKTYSYTNLDTTGIELNSKMNVEIADHVEIAGDLLYFKPLLYDAYDKNPFSLDKREYPVEYAYPFNEIVMVKFPIPIGYSIESLPKPIKLVALNNMCQFAYNIVEQNNLLSITSSITINQTIIGSEQYAELKSFFEKVVEKHLEQIVLKRTL